MLPYVDSFQPEDRARLFDFLALFARWECALKRTGFARRGAYDRADADWNRFAVAYEAVVAALTHPTFLAARQVLLGRPPDQEVMNGNVVEWRPNPRRNNESDTGYLFRVVRDVRNNLFHGGKFATGLQQDLARDRELVDSATTILESVAAVDHGIRAILEERV